MEKIQKLFVKSIKYEYTCKYLKKSSFNFWKQMGLY